MKHPYHIDSDEAARLSKDELPLVMGRLIWAESHRLHLPSMAVETSLRINDPDGGVDARVHAGASGSLWMPAGTSVWQFKAGKEISKADIDEEVQKPGVVAALTKGDTYCLVLGADFIPAKIQQLKQDLASAVETVQPGSPSRLLYAANIAEWATDHPIMLYSFDRVLPGIWPLHWLLERQPQHRIPFQPDQTRSDILTSARERLTLDDGPIHLRIEGAAGVGKTRLALQIFAGSEEMILYAPDPPPDDQLFQWMARREGAQATLVVDECSPQQALHLEDLTQLSQRRLRLLTIGHAPAPGKDADTYVLPPLSEDQVRAVVRVTSVTLGEEQQRWIARVAQGYVKLATALAEAAAKGSITVTDLTSTFKVRHILDGLLPDPQVRKAMRGLALLTRVGWEREVAMEGHFIAQLVGIPWDEMQEAIHRGVQLGLVSKQGRYRYVTPDLLALWLATDLIQARKNDILAFYAHLPTTQARDSLFARLGQLTGLKEAEEMVRELLSDSGPFDSLDALEDEQASKLFFVLAQGHADVALTAMERLVDGATHEQLVQFRHGRFHIVPLLKRFAAYKETFHRAARLLLRLAEAENQTWGNNATGVWTNLFLTHVGGTEVAALERYPALVEGYQAGTMTTRELVVEALKMALTLAELGNSLVTETGGVIPPLPWRPQTWAEDHSYRRAALRLLDQALRDTDEQVRSKALSTLLEVTRGLIKLRLADDVISRLEELEVAEDAQRRAVWDTIKTALKYEEAILTEEQRHRLEQRAAQLFGTSFHDRIRRYVGRPSLVDSLREDAPLAERPQTLAAQLAEEAFQAPETLRAEFPWLASREAENVWFFGQRLGELDQQHTWWDEIIEATRAGNDTLFLCAYLQGRADAGEVTWREQVLDEWASDPSTAIWVLEATWRGPATTSSVERLVRLVDQGWLSSIHLIRLVYGAWVRPLNADDFGALLERVMTDPSPAVAEAALALLVQWEEAHDKQLPDSIASLAWTHLERTAGMSELMIDYYWAKIGQVLFDQDRERIIELVLDGIAAREIPHLDERLGLLSEALKQSPDSVWNILSQQLLTQDRLAPGLRLWAWGQQLLDKLDAAGLLEWARQDPETRPQLLARLLKPGETITPLVRGILQGYGPESYPAGILVSNFVSGSWMGSMSQHEQQQIAIVKGWLQDPEPNVRRWARLILKDLGANLRQIQVFEEELP